MKSLLLHRGIGTWLMVLVVVPLLPAYVFWAFSALQYAAVREQQVETALVVNADHIAARVAGKLDKAAATLQTLARNNSVQSGDLAALHRVAQRVQESSSDVAAISYVDDARTMRFITLRDFGAPTAWPAGMEAVGTCLEQSAVTLSGPFSSPYSEDKLIAVNVPVKVAGRTTACLRAVMRTSDLSAELARAPVPPGWIVALFNAQGSVAARSLRPAQFIGQQVTAAGLEAIQHRRYEPFDGTTLEGEPIRTLIRPIPGWSWVVGVGVPKSLLTREVRKEVLSIVGVAVLTFLGSILAARWLSRRIVLTIRSILHDTRRVLDGEPVPERVLGIAEFDDMRRRLTEVDHYNRSMEARVTQRTAALREARERMTAFAARQKDAFENERRRLARDVHDQIGAVFTGMRLVLQRMGHQAPSEAQLGALRDAIDTGIDTARRIATELRPPLLDDLGLEAALEELLRTRFEGTDTGHEVRLLREQALDATQAIVVFRIVQEACTNTLRHAHATSFSVMGQPRDDGSYDLTVEDNGVGLGAVKSPRQGLGLQGMKERADLIGATLALSAGPQGGTRIALHLPAHRVADDTKESGA